MIKSETPAITQPSKVNAFLKLNYQRKDEIWLTSQRTLRKLIGILGISLPLLLVAIVYLDVNYFYPMDSISHYYFTRANSVFIIVVSLLGIFLLIYKGMDPIDFYLSSAAGLFALLLVLFPTSNITTCGDTEKMYSITVLRTTDYNKFRIAFHYISAGIFLLCLAMMSIFLFTKSNTAPDQRPRNKKYRNRIYRICGVLMVLALVTVFLGFLNVIPKDIYDRMRLTFWMETVAIEAFGLSWLVKGEAILRDSDQRLLSQTK